MSGLTIIGPRSVAEAATVRPASVSPAEPPEATVDQLRSRISGWHFAQEALTVGEREILRVAEAVLAELDRRDADGYAR